MDGACRGNGTLSVKVIVGVYVGPRHPYSCGRVVRESGARGAGLSNQTAELLALKNGILVGTRLAEEKSCSRVVIASDSAYACGEVTTWIHKWRQTGYEGVQNAAMFKCLDQMVEKSNIHI